MPLPAGARVGPYTIRDLVGRGGMGEVYLADDPRLGRRVAIKRLTEAQPDHPDARARLLREARAAAALNHPNIAAIHDVLESDGQPYIVMEYVEGESLAERLGRGRLPLPALVHFALEICDGLAEAHRAGIVHRDLKPANLRVTTDGRVKILDFGLAKAAKGAFSAPSLDTVTGSAHVVGSPAYMSPEQWLNAPIDRRSDIYSLGVVLFEMATGRRPTNTRPFAEFALDGAPPAGGVDIDPDVPDELRPIIARAMAPRPGDRYQWVPDLRADLARVGTAHEEQTTRSTDVRPTGSRAPSAWLRRPALLAIAALMVLVLAVFAVQLLRGRIATRAPVAVQSARPVIAVMPMTNLSGDPAKQFLGAGVADTIATTLARIKAITVVPGTARGRSDNTDTAKLARELGARFLVNGGVQQSGDQIRISARLVRPDGSIVGGEVLDGTLSDFFKLQGRLAESISSMVQVTLTAAERDQVSASQTRDAEALAAYWEGRSLLDAAAAGARDGLARAIERFQRALDRDQNFALAHAGLGQAYWKRYLDTKDVHFTEMAIVESQAALRLDPSQPMVAVALATVYNGTGRAGDAIALLQDAVRRQGNDDAAHLLLGDILARQGRSEEGIAEIRKAIDLRPDFWSHHTRLGVTYYNLGRLPQAAAEFRRATELQPDSPVAFHMLGTVYQAMGDDAQALKNYARVAELGPTAQTYLNIGVIQYDARRYKEAADAFERAVALKPKEALNHIALGDAYGHLGDAARARASFTRAAQLAREDLRVNPRDGGSLATVAVCEAKLGRFADARRHASAAAALSPKNKDVLYRQAVVYALAHDTTRALESLQAAIANGYSRTRASKDDEFQALRALPQFQRAVGQQP